MGCGKSSVGKELATLLSCDYADLDAVIEAAAGRSIPEIFATDGEAAFRRMEQEALEAVIAAYLEGDQISGREPECSRGPLPNNFGPLPLRWGAKMPLPHSRLTSTDLVLSLGGGTVMTPACSNLVHEHTICIYLRASIDTLLSHLAGEASSRPLLASPATGSTSGSSATAAAEAGHSPLRQRISTLMSQRSSTYEKTAHIIIDTDSKSIVSIAREILQKLH